MKVFYVPAEIAEEYRFIVPHDHYYDLYNTDILEPHNEYTFYRFYYDLEKDLYTTETTDNIEYFEYLNCIQVIPSHSMLVRDDIHNILFTSSCIFLFIVVLINIVTSILKNGGVLSGLL